MSASTSHDHPSRVDISVEPERERVVLAPHGDLDARVAYAIEQEVAELVSRGFTHIVLDVRDLFFVGSSGLELLARLEASAVADGHTFNVRAGTPSGARRPDTRRRFERASSERSL